MINPWHSYKAKDGIIERIDPIDSYIPYVHVRMSNGNVVSGSLDRCHEQWRRLKVGQRVGVFVRFSITMDKFMVDRLVIRRKVAV